MTLPDVITAKANDRDLRQWLQTHASTVDGMLAAAGAVLFRGFDVTNAEQFHDVATVPLGPLMQYVEGASPRSPLGAGVYTSTEYARELSVALHNELSYSHRWPARLAFFCRVPAADGGQTPLADSRRVYQRLAQQHPLPDTIEYRRVMPAGKGFGVSWPTVFATDDRAAVESYCQQAGITFQWLPGGALRTSQLRPTAMIHPLTGDKVWFNQAHQWHPSNSGEESEAALRALFGDDLPMNAVTADGTELDHPSLQSIRAAYQAETVAFGWQPGDVLIIDNMLTAHGRTPYSGDREVLVAMGGPLALADLQAVTP
jgi:alpha-ketoglutarate-dependent taurine dioxygenase